MGQEETNEMVNESEGNIPEASPDIQTEQAETADDSGSAAVESGTQPEAWRPVLNEAISALAQSMQERIDKLERAIAVSHMREQRQPPPQKPKENDEFAKLFENPLFWQQSGADPRALNYFMEKFRASDEKYSALEKEFRTFVNTVRERELGNKIASEFEQRTEQALKMHNVQLPPKAKAAMEKVIGYEALCLPDPRRVDIQRIVKEFVDTWKETQSSAKSAQAAAAAVNASKPSVGGGAPARPGTAKKKYRSMADAIGEFRSLAQKAFTEED